MLRAASGILGEIVQSKYSEVEGLRPRAAELEEAAYRSLTSRRSFVEALRRRQPAIIAELKKASPSKGLLQPDFHPAAIASSYEQGGAACLSVLTDRQYFQGGPEDLIEARNATKLPALRKDFTVDPVQIYQAAALGADAILLIAAVLTSPQMRSFREMAETLQLAALVEVHNQDELSRAIDSGATLIGVNNRNLETFEVTLQTSLRLSERIPASAIRVSESGIFTRSDIDLLQDAGFNAFLVGESLMKAPDPAAALRALTQ
jgi:indole-3-glycerol phosphate synthase